MLNPEKNTLSEIYIGTMSGTSADGLDVAICQISSSQNIKLIASQFSAYPQPVRQEIIKLQLANKNSLNNQFKKRLIELDKTLANFYANEINQLLAEQQLLASQIKAIGNHGQTILHQPNIKQPFSLQICDPAQLAKLTNIAVIADFRTADILQGGQGAPLMPAFHAHIFAKHAPCAIVNIGGIANTTLIQNKQVTGFDNGPGNTLLDQWIKKHTNQEYDRYGEWASSGIVNDSLLKQLLMDDYFQSMPPKSTGQDYFNLNWLAQFELTAKLKPEDVQATLCELTCLSILNDIEKADNASSIKHIFVCGGGAHNRYLMSRLENLLEMANKKNAINTTSAIGIHPDWVEAMGFAWLAYCHTKDIPGNLPSVTGAVKTAILGQRFDPPT